MFHSSNYINSIFAALMLLVLSYDLSAQDDIAFSSFAIPDSVEADTGYNRMLQRYLYQCVRGDECLEFNRDSLATLFRKPSFFSCSVNLMISENDAKNNIMYKDNPLLWADSVQNILYNCTDKEVVYSIVDYLLAMGESRGLSTVWEYCDIKKLQHYQAYKRHLAVSRNYLILSELAVICHNSLNKREERKLLSLIRNISPESESYLQNLFIAHQFISYFDYSFDYFEEMLRQQ